MSSSVELVVVPRTADLGDGFQVRRALPSARRRMVGPFVFLDEMGPAALAAGRGLDVRPHPHIGLATVTYLFEGEILHRDSLGSVQAILPGELNWMTAGSGIAHSERTPPDVRRSASRLAGIQAWVALPHAHEEAAPAFAHHGAASLPLLDGGGRRIRVIVGDWEGARSPANAFTDTIYAEVVLDAGADVALPNRYEERAAYVVSGAAALDGETHEAGRLLVFRAGSDVVVRAATRTRLMVLGGEPMDGPRHVWWNFVSSSRERIEQAKSDWENRRFAPVPGETEFIPLPEGKPAPVHYP